jgi:endonuclease-3
MRLAKLLDYLEAFYGKPKPPSPTEPYEMVLHRNCGYPQSDANCDKGFAALKKSIGLSPSKIFNAPDARLRATMRPSVMMAAMAARRLKEIAARYLSEFEGDKRAVEKMPPDQAKKTLMKFPTIGESGAEKILLYADIAPVAAVPANCIHVLTRLGFGHDYKNWAATYKSAQEALQAEVPEEHRPRLRAYLLIKKHGQTLCKAARPKCDQCPISAHCNYYRNSGQSLAAPDSK